MQMRRVITVLSILALAQLAVTTQAYAASPPASGTLGWVIGNFVNSTQNFANLLAILAYIGGTYLAVNSMLKFKNHVDNPVQTPLGVPLRRILAGGLLLGLPFSTEAAFGSLFGTAVGTNFLSLESGRTAGALTAGTMEAMIHNFVSNIYWPTTVLLRAFCYFSGIAILILGISRLTKRAEDGPRGPAGSGTIACFIIAGALISFGDSAAVFATSLFGNSAIQGNAEISASVIANVGDRMKIEKVIEALMAFIMIVGFIAFIRGWFVLKSFAEGNQSATIAQGLTFLIGGTLAINLGDLINILQRTLGITSGALTFI